ncbi:MAG TPA: hypothetical protein PKE47_12950 [Verrucomicrobiota bacterium]|nr:hypothetical protein [Verrucomicrobiota bacterium]
MTDKMPLSAFETTSTTTVTFKLAAKPDGSVTCLQMVDKNDQPFPDNDIVVGQDKFIEFINATVTPDCGPDTSGTLVIFFQKGPNNQPGSPLKDGVKARLIDPNKSWSKRIKRLAGPGDEAYSFTAVALTAGGDVATFDPRIIIKPQNILQGS